MKHEMTQWKCFVPGTPSFCDHTWFYVELFSETEHKMALISIIIAMDTRPSEKLVMKKERSNSKFLFSQSNMGKFVTDEMRPRHC